MPSISLCMIAKNEEEWIAQAISSVRPIISEIILVDTGSSDATVEIAKAHSAQVYFMPWRDDFSAARNLSLQYATGDWILVLDADEVIAAEDHQELLRLIEDRSLCIEFLQRHYSDDVRLSDFQPVKGEYPQWEKGQGGYFESNCVRMFPNFEGIHYRGRVHELVEHSIRDIGRHKVVRTHVRIHHYGHTSAVKAKKDKSRIYTPLGYAKTIEAPRDWKNFFELGVEHNNNGQLQESVEAFRQAALMNPGYTAIWINKGYVECELQLYQEAIRSLETALKIDPREEEAYCNLGVVYMRLKNYPLAEKHFRAAVTYKPNYVNAYCNLGTCLALMNRLSEAVVVYLRVLEMFPRSIKAHSEVGAIYLSAGVLDEAEKHLLTALDLGSQDARILFHLGQLYQLSGKNKEAVDYLEQFCACESAYYGAEMPAAQQQFIGKIRAQIVALSAPSAVVRPQPQSVDVKNSEPKTPKTRKERPKKSSPKEVIEKKPKSPSKKKQKSGGAKKKPKNKK